MGERRGGVQRTRGRQLLRVTVSFPDKKEVVTGQGGLRRDPRALRARLMPQGVCAGGQGGGWVESGGSGVGGQEAGRPG